MRNIAALDIDSEFELQVAEVLYAAAAEDLRTA